MINFRSAVGSCFAAVIAVSVLAPPTQVSFAGETESAAKNHSHSPKMTGQQAKLAKIVSKLGADLNQYKVDTADALMTTQGRKGFYLNLLFASRGAAENPTASISAGQNAPAASVLKEVGYDQIDIDLVGDGATIEQIEQREEEVYQAMGSAQERIAAAEKLLKSFGSLAGVNPFAGVITDIQIDGKTANVMLTDPELLEKPSASDTGNPSGVSWGEIKPVSSIVRFVTSDQGWQYDGFNKEAMYEFGERFSQQMFKNVRLQGEDLEGTKVNLADHRGKHVLIDFWGSWCVPCVAELPRLKMIHAELQSKGFEIIGVAVDDREALENFTKGTPLPWKSIFDEQGEVASNFLITAYPTTLLIDDKGNHVGRNLEGKELLDELLHRLHLKPDDYKELSEKVESYDPSSVFDSDNQDNTDE